MSDPQTPGNRASLDDSVIVARVDRYQNLSFDERAAERKKLIDEFPHLEEELNACLNGLELIDAVAGNVESLAFDPTDSMENFQPQQLGDFRIVREIARGGMGVVYEAIQLSLDRRVALKVLPYASFLTPNRLQRFKQEAQAAAALTHPNIVHVHCVGVDRSVHYYAMELIEGHSLAEEIEQLRQSEEHSDSKQIVAREPQKTLVARSQRYGADTVALARFSTIRSTDRRTYFKRVAEIGAQLADALDYAHEAGIIHRDIKPSNVLLDADGKPWIADFGLAQTQEDRGLTITGDLLGTLRYMSPEQADGRKLLDQRTDIYSLAATISELLTTLPVIDGASRAQILRQLDEGRVRSPRSIEPLIPVDLEKVLLKALSLEPADRYDLARDFGRDLRAFSEDKPVDARPTSRFTKLTKWASRHRSLAALLCATLLLLLAIAIAGPITAVQFRLAATAAEKEREHAEEQRHAAEESNRQLIRLLSETLDTTTQVVENVPENEFVSYDLITNTFDQIERLRSQDPNNPQLRYLAGKAYALLGWAAHFRFDQKEQAAEWYQTSYDILRPLVDDFPDNLEYRYMLNSAIFCLAQETSGARHEEYAAEMLSNAKQLVRTAPDNDDYQQELATATYFQTKLLLAQGQTEAAEKAFEEADQVFARVIQMSPGNIDARCLRAWSLWTHGKMLFDDGRRDESYPKFARALELYGSDFANTTISTRWRIGRAQVLRELARYHVAKAEFVKAEPYIRQAVEALKRICIGFPQARWPREVLYDSLTTLLPTYALQGKYQEAISMGVNSEDGIKTDGARDVYFQSLFYLQLGNLMCRHGDKSKGRRMLERVLESRNTQLRIRLRCTAADESLLNYQEVIQLVEETELHSPFRLGIAHFRLQNFKEAKKFFCEKVRRNRERTNEPGFKFYMAMTHHRLGETTAALEHFEQAMAMAITPRYEYDDEVQELFAESAELFGETR